MLKECKLESCFSILICSWNMHCGMYMIFSHAYVPFSTNSHQKKYYILWLWDVYRINHPLRPAFEQKAWRNASKKSYTSHFIGFRSISLRKKQRNVMYLQEKKIYITQKKCNMRKKEICMSILMIYVNCFEIWDCKLEFKKIIMSHHAPRFRWIFMQNDYSFNPKDTIVCYTRIT